MEGVRTRASRTAAGDQNTAPATRRNSGDAQTTRTGARPDVTAVTYTTVQRQTPDTNAAATDNPVPRTRVPERSLFSRTVYGIPGAVGSLLSSSWRVIKENLIEGLVTYAVYSVAPGVAEAFARATGLNFNGVMGSITVTGRKIATTAATGLWNLIPPLRRQRNNGGNQGAGNPPAPARQQPANPTGEGNQEENGTRLDGDLPTGLGNRTQGDETNSRRGTTGTTAKRKRPGVSNK